MEFTTVTAATRTELLDSGDIDCVIATFTITEVRKESWDFSTAYYTDAVTVLVEDASGITTLADLVGKTVGVSSGSTSAKALVTAMIEAEVISAEGFDGASSPLKAGSRRRDASGEVLDVKEPHGPSLEVEPGDHRLLHWASCLLAPHNEQCLRRQPRGGVPVLASLSPFANVAPPASSDTARDS